MISYIKGDATSPVGEGKKVLIHCCNNVGKWGKGFVIAVSKKWKEPEFIFKKCFYSNKNSKLGDIQPVEVSDDIIVINLIGQDNIYPVNNIPPIRYNAVRNGLKSVRLYVLKNGGTVHMPKIGAGLAGGDWNKIAEIIEEELHDINVFVYSL